MEQIQQQKSSLLRADDSPLSVLRQTVFHDYDKFVIPQEVKLREGFKKSKWKFKMAFAMKGAGVSSAIYLFWKMIFLKTI